MDFGDLLLLIFIVAGLLSTLAGGKKKRKGVPQARSRLPRQPSPRLPDGATGPREVPQSEPSLDPGARPVPTQPVPTQMEEILRQLGLDVGREPEVEEPEPAAEREAEPHSMPLRDEPRVVSLEEEALNLPDDDREQLHSEFHEKYIRPLDPVDRGSRSSRARIRLNPTTLREAIILREILGPPKGLQ